jgi:hypothetical protein
VETGPRSVTTIPSSDQAFADHVAAVHARHRDATAGDFERRLRKVFPRVVVRERSLSGEVPILYVYRDGAWRPDADGPWWRDDGLPRLVVSEDGWVVEASRTAADLLAFGGDADLPHHFTDFVVPGALEEAMELFEVVKRGNPLDATILLRPLSGDVIAVDLHVSRDGDRITSVIRLAEDVDIPAELPHRADRPGVEFKPATDVAFGAYTERAIERMPEPTTTGLELRLRRLYPHASVEVNGDEWIVHRDHQTMSGPDSHWWLEPAVARVRYDAQALILEANEGASALFGRELVGHYWQEFVTAGSTEQVSVMLEILAEVGAAESRFRMPRPDGSLLEFDSYTEVHGDEFTTSFRPVTAATRS